MNVTLILNLTSFVIINIPSYGDSKIVYSFSATHEDVNSLDSINPGQELPLIFFQDENSKELKYPLSLVQVEIENGRIYSSETKFLAILSSTFKQTFFCPHENARMQCLVEKQFKKSKSQELQCDSELKPSFTKISSLNLRGCGPKTDGMLFSFGYKICDNRTPPVNIYSVCYRGADEEIVFVQYRLMSAKLIDEELLLQERGIYYVEDLVINAAKFPFPYVREKLNTAYQIKLTYYRIRYLIPPQNMAFAAWKKATYHYVNYALQQKKLVDLWDEINSYIRHDAIKMFLNPRHIFAGVMKIPENRITTPLEYNVIYNIWITVIVELSTEISPRALVILMNNFVTKTNPSDTDEQSADASKSNLQFINELCGDEESFCEKNLNEKFTQIKGEVRCCKLTDRIEAQFNINKMLQLNVSSEMLKIENLTTP